MAEISVPKVYPKEERISLFKKLMEHGFTVNDFDIDEMPFNDGVGLVFRAKGYKPGTTNKYFHWIKKSDTDARVGYCPGDNFQSDQAELTLKTFTSQLNEVLNYFDNFLVNLKKLFQIEDEYDQLVNQDFANFVNSDYWNSNEPIPTSEKPLFIELLAQAVNRLGKIPDKEIPPVVKNYYILIFNTTINNIEQDSSRKIIRDHLLALGYCVMWDCILHPENKILIWNIIKSLCESIVNGLGWPIPGVLLL